MSSRGHPQAPIFPIRIFQGDPQAHHTWGFRDQVAGILVPANLATDARLLEDQHGLPEQRVLQSKGLQGVSDQGLAAERFERRYMVMQCMSKLVDRPVSGYPQFARLVQGLVFEKVFNRLRGAEEHLVAL